MNAIGMQGSLQERRTIMAAAVERIAPREARMHVAEGALLVCAYDSEEKFRRNHLEGALSLDEFRSRAGSIPKDREVIFYCA
jgi:rhodanese-related sulfurtransferase